MNPDWVALAVDAHMRRQESILRNLLSQWVSELEPVILFGRDQLQMKGLGIKDDPTGMVVLHNPEWLSSALDQVINSHPRRY